MMAVCCAKCASKAQRVLDGERPDRAERSGKGGRRGERREARDSAFALGASCLGVTIYEHL